MRTVSKREALRDAQVRRERWPLPEMLAGAVAGGQMLFMFIELFPAAAALPKSVEILVGAAIGAVASYYLAPRRFVATRKRIEEEQPHLTQAA
jgi:hypothetical protein